MKYNSDKLRYFNQMNKVNLVHIHIIGYEQLQFMIHFILIIFKLKSLKLSIFRFLFRRKYEEQLATILLWVYNFLLFTFCCLSLLKAGNGMFKFYQYILEWAMCMNKVLFFRMCCTETVYSIYFSWIFYEPVKFLLVNSIF